jgi:hypothetical protein
MHGSNADGIIFCELEKTPEKYERTVNKLMCVVTGDSPAKTSSKNFVVAEPSAKRGGITDNLLCIIRQGNIIQ